MSGLPTSNLQPLGQFPKCRCRANGREGLCRPHPPPSCSSLCSIRPTKSTSTGTKTASGMNPNGYIRVLFSHNWILTKSAAYQYTAPLLEVTRRQNCNDENGGVSALPASQAKRLRLTPLFVWLAPRLVIPLTVQSAARGVQSVTG